MMMICRIGRTIAIRQHYACCPNSLARIYKHQQQRDFAGHNKWSKIRHKKGARDESRAKEFGKATKAIRAASKLCAGDMSNLHLQSAIARAKSLQVPKERILEAIHGNSKSNDDDLVSIRYDCRVPTSSGKVSFIIMALTNNRNRTFTNLRTLVSKTGGEILNTGTNDWFFDHVGVALIEKYQRQSDDSLKPSKNTVQLEEILDSNGLTLSEQEKDQILEHFLDVGAEDVDFGLDSDEHFMVRCNPNDLHRMVSESRSKGYTVTEFESRYIAKNDCVLDMNQSSTEELSKFIEKLDDDDDVSSFYHTANED